MLVKNTVEKRCARVLKTRANVRQTFPPEPELRSLARSVIKRQLHPFIILPDNIILDGECRWRGLMLEAPDFEVDVIVVDRELAPAEVCELQMISAMHSTSLEPFDQAVACKDWLAQNPNATAKELAEKIDRDPSMLTRLLALWKTIPAVVAAAEKGAIGPKAWYQISLASEADQSGLLEMYLAKMPSAQIAEISRKKRQPSNGSAVKVNRIKCPVGGSVVQVSGNDLDLSAMIDLLSDLIKQARKANDEGQDARAFMAVLKSKQKVAKA